jgi:hypothetical protein
MTPGNTKRLPQRRMIVKQFNNALIHFHDTGR